MTSETETHEAIGAANERIVSTFGQAEAAGMAALHTEQEQLLPPNAVIILRELTLQMAQAVVTHPERVRVEATAGASIIILDLRVDPENMGRVIGKEGRGPTPCAPCYPPLPLRQANGSLWKLSKFREGYYE